MKNYLQTTTRILVGLIVLSLSYSCEEIIPAGVNFAGVTNSQLEGDGSQSVEIELTRSAASEITIEVAYSGTADYSTGGTFITIPAGETTASLNFDLIDNNDYEPGVTKTVIIELVGISGPGVDDAGFGTFTTFTTNVDEDDMQIDLTWTPSSGTASEHDLDLWLEKNSSDFKFSTSVDNTTESIILLGSDDNTNYQAISHRYSGSLVNIDVNYSITLNFPDGSTQTHSDVFTATDNADRTLWQITKNGSLFSATQDPFGTSGRIGSVASIKNR